MSEIFSGKPGKFVELNETLEGFAALLEGAGDEYPEGAFYMTGNLKEAFEQGRKMAEAAL
jgi:F0F1-type ATP synthase beta subunit